MQKRDLSLIFFPNLIDSLKEKLKRLRRDLLILPTHYNIDIESLLRKARLGMWGAVSVVSLFSMSVLFLQREKMDSPVFLSMSNPDEEIKLDEIGKGVLSLNPMRKSSLVPDLSREILVLARSSRPDCDPKDRILLLSTKSNSEQRTVTLGEQIFLSCNKKKDEEPTYTFSDKKTPLWIKPILSGQEDICLEIGQFSPCKEGEGFLEEVGQVLVQQVRSSAFKEKRESAFLSSIRQAKWWGNDCLLKQYGGQEYREMMQKQKVEIPSEFGSQFYFLSAGDYLEWQEGCWQQTPLSSAKPGCPLAFVKSISSKNMEVEVWDEKGFYPQILNFELQNPSKLQKTDLNNSLVRLRSSSQVTCTLGKRRFILKEGDWLLKVGKSWRNLKRSKDIEDCLQHKLRGELFIFDSIDKEQGKLFLKGSIFDEMRMQITPVSIPISPEEHSSSKGKKTKASPLFKMSRYKEGKNEK